MTNKLTPEDQAAIDAVVEEVVNDPEISALFDSIEENLHNEREAFRKEFLEVMLPLQSRYKSWVIERILLDQVTEWLTTETGPERARKLMQTWIDTKLPEDETDD